MAALVKETFNDDAEPAISAAFLNNVQDHIIEAETGDIEPLRVVGVDGGATTIVDDINDINGDITDIQTDITTLQPVRIIITDAGTTYTIAEAADNTEYQLGTLTSLTVTAFPAGNFECLIVFTAGATISVSLPVSVKWNGAETPIWTSGKIYEISLKNGRGVAGEF